MLVPGSVPVSSKNSGPTGQRSQLTSLELVMPKHYVVVEDGKDQALLGQTGLVTREIVPCLFFFIPCRPCTTERLENETTQQKPSIRLERSLWKSLKHHATFPAQHQPEVEVTAEEAFAHQSSWETKWNHRWCVFLQAGLPWVEITLMSAQTGKLVTLRTIVQQIDLVCQRWGLFESM